MKQIIILLSILLIMAFVIAIPIMEERHHIKHDPHFLDGKYELKNPTVQSPIHSHDGQFCN